VFKHNESANAVHRSSRFGEKIKKMNNQQQKTNRGTLLQLQEVEKACSADREGKAEELSQWEV